MSSDPSLFDASYLVVSSRILRVECDCKKKQKLQFQIVVEVHWGVSSKLKVKLNSYFVEWEMFLSGISFLLGILFGVAICLIIVLMFIFYFLMDVPRIGRSQLEEKIEQQSKDDQAYLDKGGNSNPAYDREVRKLHVPQLMISDARMVHGNRIENQLPWEMRLV